LNDNLDAINLYVNKVEEEINITKPATEKVAAIKSIKLPNELEVKTTGGRRTRSKRITNNKTMKVRFIY